MTEGEKTELPLDEEAEMEGADWPPPLFLFPRSRSARSHKQLTCAPLLVFGNWAGSRL